MFLPHVMFWHTWLATHAIRMFFIFEGLQSIVTVIKGYYGDTFDMVRVAPS